VRFLIAIPVYNEQRYVARVLNAVSLYGYDILVIDDGSTDQTPELIARFPHIHAITHIENRGYGQSLIDAFQFASSHGYDWVLTLDCDEQHEPAQIPEFVERVLRNDADVISGSRYLVRHPDDDSAPPERRRINHIVNRILAQTLDLKLTDSFCGFKAHRVAAMRQLDLDEPGYAFPLQFWVQCVYAGLRIAELPVRRIYRDKSREFGGTLDDPSARLQHYLEVFVCELQKTATCGVARGTRSFCRYS